jgi:hypothetical protein
MEQKERTQDIPANEQVQGRTDNTGDKNRQQNNAEDISQIDRQEGNENPGETGGDFKSTSPDIKKGTAGNG